MPSSAGNSSGVMVSLSSSCFTPISRYCVRSCAVSSLRQNGRARRVTVQPSLAGFEKLFRPVVVETLSAAFLSAQRGNTLLASKAYNHNADLFLGGEGLNLLWVNRLPGSVFSRQSAASNFSQLMHINQTFQSWFTLETAISVRTGGSHDF